MSREPAGRQHTLASCVLTITLMTLLGACESGSNHVVGVVGTVTDAETYQLLPSAEVCATISVDGDHFSECTKSQDSGFFRLFFDWDIPQYSFTLTRVEATKAGYAPFRFTNDAPTTFYPDGYVLRDIRMLPVYLNHEPPALAYEYAMPGVPVDVTGGNSWAHYVLLNERRIQRFGPHSQPYLGTSWRADTTLTALALDDDVVLHAVAMDFSVRQYSSDGTVIASRSFAETVPSEFAPDRLLMAIGAQGSILVAGEGTSWICRLSFSSEDVVWESVGEARIVELAANADGEVWILGEGVDAYDALKLGPDLTVTASWSLSRGEEISSVSQLGGLAVTSTGDLLVSDAANDRVLRFSPTGEFLTRWGMSGSEFGQLSGPGAIAAERGWGFSVFVCDSGNRRIQEFQFNPAVWQ